MITIHKITIEAVLNGFICRVGCETVVFESVDVLLIELRTYLANPESTERRYLTRALNAKHTHHPQPAETPPDRGDLCAAAPAQVPVNVAEGLKQFLQEPETTPSPGPEQAPAEPSSTQAENFYSQQEAVLRESAGPSEVAGHVRPGAAATPRYAPTI